MTITATENRTGMVKKIDFAWELTTTDTTGGSSTYCYDGEVIRVVTSNTLTAGGAITLQDSDGYDVLLGVGALTTGTGYILGTTDGSNRIPGAAIANSALTFGITNMTTGGSGHCIVYVR